MFCLQSSGIFLWSVFRECNLQSVPSVLFRSFIHALVCAFPSCLHVLCPPFGWSGRHELFPPTAWPCPSQFQMESWHSQPFCRWSIPCLVFWLWCFDLVLLYAYQSANFRKYLILTSTSLNNLKLKALITLTGLLPLPLGMEFYLVV